jgi:hypothetical protein
VLKAALAGLKLAARLRSLSRCGAAEVNNQHSWLELADRIFLLTEGIKNRPWLRTKDQISRQKVKNKFQMGKNQY